MIVLKWTFKKYLIKALIGIAVMFILVNAYKSVTNTVQPVKIIKQHHEVAESKYIISEEMVMSQLRGKSQIVSLEQSLHKKDTYVDENWAGLERHTELKVHGKYKLGIETKDIEIKHIDNENGIIYLHIGKPTLISLDIPYHEIEFKKTNGWLRMAMDEKEEKNFYKSVEKNIHNEIINNKELMKQADLHNKDVIMGLLKMIPEVKSVVFN